MSAPPPLLDRLRTRGWRLTAQRRVVAEAMTGDNVHMTADEVLERARRLLPEISRATVYNTLNELVELGEVAEIPGPDRVRRYDPNAVVPHQHLACEVCGGLWDVHAEGVEALHPDPAALGDFEVASTVVTFRGVCAACRGR
ncbi:MAG: transcriptional repressor [Actinomyces sp.]|nr:MAG: transcriptional repressor [Actinomyces sp.]